MPSAPKHSANRHAKLFRDFLRTNSSQTLRAVRTGRLFGIARLFISAARALSKIKNGARQISNYRTKKQSPQNFCGRPAPYSKLRNFPFGRPNARNGGRGGGRTHERYNRTDLQSASFDHLDTLPINLKPLLYLAGCAAQAFFCRIRSFFERLFKRKTALSPISASIAKPPGRRAKPPARRRGRERCQTRKKQKNWARQKFRAQTAKRPRLNFTPTRRKNTA